MVTREQLGWLAGLFDGEGCVLVLKDERVGGWVYTVALDIANTSPWIIDQALQILQALGFHPTVFGQKESRFADVNPAYKLRVATKQEALECFQTLAPHLNGKRDEAEVAIWYLLRSCAEQHHKVTDEERLVLQRISEIKEAAGVVSPELRSFFESHGVRFSRTGDPPLPQLAKKGLRRNVTLLQKEGLSLPISEWAKRLGIPIQTIYWRKAQGASDEDALRTD